MEKCLDWKNYRTEPFYDELITASGNPRVAAKQLANHVASLTTEQLEARGQAAEATIRQMGIGFTVYTEEGNIDRAWPFDIIPRAMSADTW